MNWLHSITNFELILLTVFAVVYLLFFVRIWRLSKYLTKVSRIILVKFALRSIYLALLIIALLGPSFKTGEVNSGNTVRNIHLIMDMSASMEASDLTPSRLEKLKIELLNIVNTFPDNRYSVMIFSGQAHWQIPLTQDTRLILDFIEGINPGLMPSEGTNINAPFTLIENYARSNPSTVKGDLLLLTTDGEFYSRPDESLLKKIKEAGIHSFILGVGTENGGSLPYSSNEEARYSRLSKREIQELARPLGARIFYLSESENDFQELAARINLLPGRLVSKNLEDTTSNKYSNFLLAGILLAMADFLFIIKIFKF